MISGGLGGLGRSAARWMASMGARNLILLSRSGPKSDAAKDLIEELTEKGVCVRTPKCDVTAIDALAAALRECYDMPRIRGCIQGTMVLQVSAMLLSHVVTEANVILGLDFRKNDICAMANNHQFKNSKYYQPPHPASVGHGVLHCPLISVWHRRIYIPIQLCGGKYLSRRVCALSPLSWTARGRS